MTFILSQTYVRDLGNLKFLKIPTLLKYPTVKIQISVTEANFC